MLSTKAVSLEEKYNFLEGCEDEWVVDLHVFKVLFHSQKKISFSKSQSWWELGFD